MLLEFYLPDYCSNCKTTVENTLAKLKQFKIKYQYIDAATKKLSVEIDDTVEINPAEIDPAEIIIKELEDVGSTCVIYPKLFSENTVRIMKGAAGIFFGAAFLGVSIFFPALPFIATAILTASSTLLSLYLGKESFVTAFKKITKSRTVEMHSLLSISAIMAIGISIASVFIPGLPSMLDSALLIFGFRHLGVAIENKAHKKLMSGLKFSQLAKRKVLVKITGNQFEERDIGDVNAGEIIKMANGDVIPLDGECQTENAIIYTTIKDGENLPKVIKKGEALLAGMTLSKDVDYLEIKVTKIEKESYLAQLDKEILKAEAQKAPLETTAAQILKYLIPALLAAAAIAGGFIGFFINPVLAIQCAATLIVSACPCTLASIIPIAGSVGLNKAAKQDAKIKSTKALQAAGDIDIVIFDLNGTLTEGKYQVKKMEIVDTDKDELLASLHYMQEKSTHPIAVAIRGYLQNKIQKKITDKDVIEQPVQPCQSGAECKINHKNIIIGNITLMHERGVDLSRYNHLIAKNTEKHVIFIAVNNVVKGYITLEDPLKKNARFVVDELKISGKQVHICTGTDKATALRYAELLGISARHVYADCIPVPDPLKPEKKTKSEYVKYYQQTGRKVAMVGDATNDTIPFADSDLGILAKSHSTQDVIHQNAGVVIDKASLLPLLSVFAIGSDFVANVKKNLALTITYNVVALTLISCLTVGLGVAINPGFGVALMIAQACYVFYSVYQFKQKKMSDEFNRRVAAEGSPKEETMNNTILHKKLGLTNEHQHTDNKKAKPKVSAKIVPYPVNNQIMPKPESLTVLPNQALTY